MINNDVIFILSFVILMENYGFLGSPLGCAQRDRVILVFFLKCLVSNGRRALLEGIRLGGSAIDSLRPEVHIPFLFSQKQLC